MKSEIGLMTAEEFLHFRNPGGKSHPSEAYDFDLFKLNREYPRLVGQVGSYGEGMLTVEELSGGYRVLNREGEMIAVIHDGIAYYDKPGSRRQIPTKVQ